MGMSCAMMRSPAFSYFFFLVLASGVVDLCSRRLTRRPCQRRARACCPRRARCQASPHNTRDNGDISDIWSLLSAAAFTPTHKHSIFPDEFFRLPPPSSPPPLSLPHPPLSKTGKNLVAICLPHSTFQGPSLILSLSFSLFFSLSLSLCVGAGGFGATM